MKVKDLTMKLYEAIIKKDEKAEKKLWLKAIKKSLKHKHTQAVQ